MVVVMPSGGRAQRKNMSGDRLSSVCSFTGSVPSPHMQVAVPATISIYSLHLSLRFIQKTD